MTSRPRTLQERVKNVFGNERSEALLHEINALLIHRVNHHLRDPNILLSEHPLHDIMALGRTYIESLVIINKIRVGEDLLAFQEIETLKRFPACLRALADSLADDRDSYRKLVRDIKIIGPESYEKPLVMGEPTMPEELKSLDLTLQVKGALPLMRRYASGIMDDIGLQPWETRYFNSSQQAFTLVADAYQDSRTRLRSFADKFETGVLVHFSRGK